MEKEVLFYEWDYFPWLATEERIDQLFDYLKTNLPLAVWQRKGTALSIGCGKGREVWQLERDGFQVIACDTNPGAIQEGLRLGYLLGEKTKIAITDYKDCLRESNFDFILVLHISPGLRLGELIRHCLALNQEGAMIVNGGREKIKEFETFFQQTDLSAGIRNWDLISDLNLIDRRILVIEK